MSYHTKECHRFLDYLIEYFNIKKPVRLILEDDLTINGYDFKGYPEVRRPHGTAQHFPKHYEIRLSVKKNKNRAGLLSTLAHEFGHIVQFAHGRYLTPGTDWEMEGEASCIGSKPFRSYLQAHHPKTLSQLGKPLDPPSWLTV